MIRHIDIRRAELTCHRCGHVHVWSGAEAAEVCSGQSYGTVIERCGACGEWFAGPLRVEYVMPPPIEVLRITVEDRATPAIARMLDCIAALTATPDRRQFDRRGLDNPA
jgi:hypothetical protein